MDQQVLQDVVSYSNDGTVMHIMGEKPVLMICFGGRGEGFCWRKRMELLSLNALHFQDSKTRWYLDGADGVPSFEEVAHIAQRIQGQRRDFTTILLGQSFGAYAALRLSTMIPCDRVIAFAPQTHAVTNRPIYERQRNFSPPPDTYDIRPDIIRSKHVPVSIFVSKTESQNAPESYFWDDHQHLEGLHGYPHIDIKILDHHSHPTAWWIAKAGKLDDLLLSEIDVATGPN